MTALLWFEVKWAIRFNMGVGVLFLFWAVGAFFMLGNPTLIFFGCMLTFPYWVKLYQIRHRWVKEAVKGA